MVLNFGATSSIAADYGSAKSERSAVEHSRLSNERKFRELEVLIKSYNSEVNPLFRDGFGIENYSELTMPVVENRVNTKLAEARQLAVLIKRTLSEIDAPSSQLTRMERIRLLKDIHSLQSDPGREEVFAKLSHDESADSQKLENSTGGVEEFLRGQLNGIDGYDSYSSETPKLAPAELKP